MFRVVTLNLNGIRAAARKGAFRWLASTGADAVCLQETKAHEHQVPAEARALDGYTVAFVDAERKGYSGVAIYLKRAPDRIVRGFGPGFEEFDAEGRFVRMDAGDLTISSLYVPSGTSGPERQAIKETFLARLTAFLAALKAEGRRTIVCGDFNIAHREIDVHDPKRCAKLTGFLPQERAWFDGVVDRAGWVDAFRVVNHEAHQYTWWTQLTKDAFERNIGWRIDYQLVTPNLRDRVRAASIYRDERFSDHAPVIVDYDLE